MAEQYFAREPGSRSRPQTFRLDWQGRSFNFLTDSGVFSKGELDYGSRVLLLALPERFEGRALDLGCGWGAVGIILAALHPKASVFMVDINERAVSLARENARLNGVQASVGQSDGFEQIQGSFDLIAFNPPVRAGKAVIYRLFADAARHLTADGALYVVLRRQQGADSAKKHLLTLYADVETLRRQGGYHVFKCRGGFADGL